MYSLSLKLSFMNNFPRILLVACSLMMSTFATSQVITTVPSMPVENQSVILTFNFADTPLNGISSDVYVHTGVNILNGNEWQYVIGSWGNNSTQPKLTKIAQNLYQLTMSPSILEYYSVPDDKHIAQMCFVARSSDGSTQTADLFVDVYQSTVSVIFTSPSEDSFVLLPDENQVVTAKSPLADSMFLYIDNQLIMTVKATVIEYYVVASDFPEHWKNLDITAIAKDAEDNTASSEITFMTVPFPSVADLPENCDNGVTAIDDNSAVFCLTAPDKKFCFLKSTFNNFLIGEDYFMNLTPDGEKFWIQIDELEPNTEYAYMYSVDGIIDVADPYCHKILDPWNDPYISDEVYPNLMSFPAEAPENIVSTFTLNEPDYQWQINDFTPPENADLIIYELHVRDFIAAHNYQTLIDTIGYLTNLGINAVELMPVNEFEGNSSWGYNPSFYFAPDKYYGTANKLKEFIDCCHENGIAVILDMVLNHSFGQSPMVRMYWDENQGTPAADNLWFNQYPTHDYNVGYDFNHESQYTKSFSKDVMKYWLTEYKVDGYRFDLSKGFTQVNTLGNTSLWGQYDASRIAIWKNYLDYIRSVDEDAIIILEHFAANSEEKELSNYGMLLWGNLNYYYNEATMGYTNSNFSDISYLKRGWSYPHLVGYMESHDEERLMYKNKEYGNSSPSGDYIISQTITGLLRNAMAAAFFFTVPGPKMIWQFGELGYDYSIDYNGRTGEKPVKWDYYDNWQRKKLFDVYKSLIKLKKEESIFATDDYETNFSGYTKSLYLNENDDHVIVVGNFNVIPAEIELDMPQQGLWYEFFYHDSITVNEDVLTLNLAPGEFKLLSTKRYFDPKLNLAISDFDEINENLVEIFPNPCGQILHFNISLHNLSDVDISIFDINSSKMLINNIYKNLSQGIHNLEINLDEYNFKHGAYIVTVKTNGYIISNKIIKL